MAYEQSTTSLRGTLSDPTGAVIPGAFRARAGMIYDRFGSDLVAQYDQYGSIGLATATNFSDSYSFSTSPRFIGAAPLTFGEFQQTTPPREMQFALRYEF